MKIIPQDYLLISNDDDFYNENEEYVNDLSKGLPLCSNCTQRSDSHKKDSSICRSPWYVTQHYYF